MRRLISLAELAREAQGNTSGGGRLPANLMIAVRYVPTAQQECLLHCVGFLPPYQSPALLANLRPQCWPYCPGLRLCLACSRRHAAPSYVKHRMLFELAFLELNA